MTWIVVDIGCIECGEGSDIVGVFSNEIKANAIAARLNVTMSFTWGQHSYQVFQMPKINHIKEAYKCALLTTP